tara:strand:+ start:328 stop:606 length:279 start_codon:yes stop_codon:yes gene_type:complete
MKEDRGDLDLTKQIEKLELQIRFLNEQLKYAADRIKDLNDINEAHRQLNGVLRKEIYDLKKSQSEHVQDKNLLHGYKKVIEDLSNRLQKTGK